MHKSRKVTTVEDISSNDESKDTKAVSKAPRPPSPEPEVPLWQQFYEIEKELNEKLRHYRAPIEDITHIYNPVEYAADLHCEYLRKYLDRPKRVVFLAVHPEQNGMAQTGVPFGNVSTVRDMMKLCGEVKQPNRLHPKHPVLGLNCHINEPSGVRFWGLMDKIAGSLDTFSEQCFVHTFCPLLFFNEYGRTIEPCVLPFEIKYPMRDLLVEALCKEMKLVQPEIIVVTGNYVYNGLQRSELYAKTLLVMTNPHPWVPNNHNWVRRSERWLYQYDIVKYLQNMI
ncbi:single-strand selective monofunctional uracil DNA glycosylase-like [Teleopsis dalmanni]|uniref:single-strand selective monofunctional uracil DNA glycosylase-like n=1 Tax=Teleopsis dalmanni TaxID=139649 RepID=UPI0018CFD622|nr:single-strand selective monofunctional uracil DNA glycosylase-like [Teleopsis dalmanni]